MASYDNESLEETQKRLASQPGAGNSPWLNRPSTAVPAAPSVPMPATVRAAAADAADAAVPLPDPYIPSASFAQPGFAQPAAAAAVAARSTRKPLVVLLSVIGVLVVLVGMVFAITRVAEHNGIDIASPFTSAIDPIWVDYPGNAYVDPDEALRSDSMEVVVADGTALSIELRDALTAEFGLVWEQRYDDKLEQGSNFYDGDSMFYDYFAGEWQGSGIVDDPGARARVAEIFSTIAAKYGAPENRLNNEIYLGDAGQSNSQFGAETLDEQAVWSFTSQNNPRRPDYTVTGRAFDRGIPTDGSFDGDVWFDLEAAGTNNFVVVLNVWSYGMLAEDDREEFAERLQPYEGLERPEPEY